MNCSRTRCCIKMVLGLIVLGGIAYGGYWWHLRHTVKKAQAALDKGFSALAAEELECHRKCLTTKEADCRLLINTYFSARMAQRLEWATQACINKGIEIPESYIGLAAAKEMNGRLDEALRVLGGVAEKFKDIPDIYYRMAQLLVRQENHAAAVMAFQKVVEKAPNNGPIVLEVLDYFARLKAWAQAKPVAEKLKTAETDNPAVKLLIARVFKNTGDEAGAKAMVEQAKPLLDKAPNKAELEKGYADVLGTAKTKN